MCYIIILPTKEVIYMPILKCPECGANMNYFANNERAQCPICKTWDFVSRLIKWAKAEPSPATT